MNEKYTKNTGIQVNAHITLAIACWTHVSDGM